ncbi:MAG TPA: hypothetical protein VGK59_17485 [Ohtaekwangia sp.]
MKTCFTFLLLALSTAVLSQTIYEDFEVALRKPKDVQQLVIHCHHAGFKIPDSRIEQLLNLEYLYIDSYPGEELILPRELLKLPKLKTLVIEGQNLKHIPDWIVDLAHLEKLSLFYGKATVIPENITALKNLKELGISSEVIQQLPETIYLNTLEYLYLHCRSIKTLPSGLGSLARLKLLTIHCDSLQELPDEFHSLTTLNRLDLYCKVMTSLPPSVSKLDNLKEFRWGQAKSFPPEVCTLKNLEQLTFDVSFFPEVPECIGELKKLKRIDLSFSRISVLPEALYAMNTLESIDLYSSMISTLDPLIFRLPKLRWISLQYCRNLPDKVQLQKMSNKVILE